MKLDKQIAQNIVQRSMRIIQHSVNVMDENGIIIASGDPKRLNQLHTGAVVALRKNQTIEIDETLSQKWNREALPGINTPIKYLGQILGVVGISGEPDSVRQYTELVKMTAELIIEQAILLEKERWERRYKEEFIALLLEEDHHHNNLEQQAKFFRFDLNVPYIVIIIKLLNPTPYNLQELVGYLEHNRNKQNFTVISIDQIALIERYSPHITPTDFTDLLPNNEKLQNYRIAIGNYFPDYQQLYLSYQTALTVLKYGLKTHPRKQVYQFTEYKLPALLNSVSGTWLADELNRPLKSLLQHDKKEVLVKSLRQYFLSNCDQDLTAKRLFIHPNTLRYRLDKIQQITGLSINKIEDKFILYCGVLLLPNL